MTNHELNIEIATRVCGWKWWAIELTTNVHNVFDRWAFLRPAEWAPRDGLRDSVPRIDEPPLEKDVIRTVPDYSGSLDACREAEMKMKERGLEEEYADELDDLATEIYDSRFDIYCATAEQRCRAMLEAIGEKT